jgi:hypothetical protein
MSIIPAPAAYNCSKTSGEVCMFPFKIRGERQLHWNCVERDGMPVCSTKKSQSQLSFASTATFEPCTACDQCPQQGTSYDGFYLSNTAGNNYYYGVTSSEECHELCQLVAECNFFLYNKGVKQCHLQYGVGRKASGSSFTFGPKQCPGNTYILCYSAT